MTLPRLAAFALVAGSCAFPEFERDPGAVAPRYDRWETTVLARPDSAYAVALGVVVEAGYTLSVTSRADRVITTNLRRQLAATGFNATEHNVRFTVSVLPAGPEASRLTVAGDRCVGRNLADCVAITAYDGGTAGTWQFVRRLGEAVAARLSRS